MDARRKRRIVHGVQKYGVNPLVRAAFAFGLGPRTHALIETIGRTSGEPRRTPVGNGLAPDRRTFWIVAEHGRDAGYVKNILANPRVRVQVGRRSRLGTAHVLPDDDPRERQRQMGGGLNAATVRLVGTDLLTVRVDLD
ncbi:MAG TPA: nitroreductase/quinone reductase family protein [Gaiellaceae bacterium]|nr:nitroreductase/quinone reductase family protein [Gaiellaceae bacterium]